MPKKIDWDSEISLVWTRLSEKQGAGFLSRAALAYWCNRTKGRVARVIAMIRDAYPEAPLVSKHEGYCITGDPVENEAYRLLVTSTILTRFRRWRTGSAEPFFRLVEQTNPAQAQWLRQQAQQMQASLELAVRSTF